MIPSLLPILAAGFLLVAFGAAIVFAIVHRFRRDLGLRPESPEKTQDVTFIINAFQDVTRQLKEKERELERLHALAEQRAENVESYTENILQCVTSGVITFDGSELAASMNRAAEEVLGLARGTGLGMSCEELFGDGATCRLVRETRETSMPSRRMEAELLRKGERKWLGFNTALLRDRQGKGLGVILSFSDLTEVKRLQEQVELKERLTALGEMSAGIAHELRNPMAVIAGYLSLLARRQDDAGQAVIKDIQAEIAGMNRIIADLLTFARPTPLNRSRTDMRGLVESCVENILQARSNGPDIVTKMDVDEATASVDEMLARQVLGNLVQNAVEAMPQGGTLAVTLRADRELIITISDTGPGIPPEHIKKVFLPFFTTKDTGVGMGLALAHKTVTAHGGRIDVESDPGKGTRFIVTLPLI